MRVLGVVAVLLGAPAVRHRLRAAAGRGTGRRRTADRGVGTAGRATLDRPVGGSRRGTGRGAAGALAGAAKPGPLRLEILDNGGSPSTAVANARTAVRRHAAALITDGTGALAVSRVTDAASLPVFVVFQGGGAFVDPAAHPTIFRLAPANRFLSRRLADYLAGRQTSTIALISDDSSYGRDGAAPAERGPGAQRPCGGEADRAAGSPPAM